MKHKFIFLLAFSCCGILAEAGNVSRIIAKPTYNRRVLLTVFINERLDKDKEYLELTIPEAFSAPLMRTGNFVILNRISVERYLKTMGISARDLYIDSNAIRLGKIVGADVVVVGKFVSNKGSITIHAKAIDVQTGALSIADDEEVKANATMFTGIDRLAKRMSGPMAKMQPLVAPPPPAEVVLDEAQVNDQIKEIERKRANPTKTIINSEPGKEKAISETSRFSFAALPLFSLPLTFVKQGFSNGLGGGLYAAYRHVFPIKLQFGLAIEYLSYLRSDERVVSLRDLTVMASVAYNLYDIGKIHLSPVIYGGFSLGSFKGVIASSDYRIPVTAFGIRAMYEFNAHLGFIAETRGVLQFDQATNFNLLIGIGAEWGL